MQETWVWSLGQEDPLEHHIDPPYDGGNGDIPCCSNPGDLRIAKIPKMCLGGGSKLELSFLLWGCGPSTNCWDIQRTPQNPGGLIQSGPSSTVCTELPASTTHSILAKRNLGPFGCGEDGGAAGWRRGCWGGDTLKPWAVSLLHQSKCVNSVQDEGPLCSEKPPSLLSKSEALGRNPGASSSNNFSIKLLSWKDAWSSLLLTAPSTHLSPHEVKSLRALGPSSIYVEQGREETKKGSERHPQPALFLLPVCLGLCSLNSFQMPCRRKKQMLGVLAKARDRPAETPGHPQFSVSLTPVQMSGQLQHAT